jgi:hypothetical protein
MDSMPWCLAVIVLVGCGGGGDDADGGRGVDGGRGADSGNVDGGGAADAGGDGGGALDGAPLDRADAADGGAPPTDASAPPSDAAALPGDLLFRFAHMEPSELPERVDVCMIATSGPTTGTTIQMYEATSGIGRYEVGAWRVLEHGEHTLELILPGGTCDDDPLYTTSITQDGLGGPRRTTYTLFSLGIGIQGTAAGDRVFPPDADDNDRIRFQPAIIEDPTTLTFEDALGTVPIGAPADYGLVMGGRSGMLTLTFDDGAPAPVTRAYEALAGGHTTVFARGSSGAAVGLTVCDDFAPPVGQLSDCRDSVRAP